MCWQSSRVTDGSLYVSSRFDGQVHRLTSDDRAEVFATGLGTATGLAFAPDGKLFVGDRSGSILRIGPDRCRPRRAPAPGAPARWRQGCRPARSATGSGCRLSVSVRTSGDEFKTRFGMRELRFDPGTRHAVLNGKPSPVPAEQSLAVGRVLAGLYESAASGREVRLD